MIRGLVLLLVGGALWGHEIGTTRVTAVFPRGGSYDVEIVTDAAALAEQLGAVGDREETFRRRVKLAFDGVEARPAITFGPTIRLTGRVPAGARQVTWS